MDINGHTFLSEDYVSYEVAKLLNKKGFDESCDYYYDQSSDEPQQFTLDEMYYSYDEFLKAPTLQMAMKWLREEKNIIINIWYNGVEWAAEHYNDEDENFYLIADSYNSHEEAVEAALKYALENLI